MLTKTAAEGVMMEVFVARCNVDRFTRLLAEATDPKEIGTLNMLLMNEQQLLMEAICQKGLIQRGAFFPFCAVQDASFMAHYRLYLLDSDNRITQEGVEIQCADDDAALLAASGIDHASVVEVWSGTRRVGEVTPE